MTNPLAFFIDFPDQTPSYWQAVWSCSVNVESKNVVDKTLLPDAGCGLLFNLGRSIEYSGVELDQGCAVLPVATNTRCMKLAADADICGVRFLPTAAFPLLGKPDRPTSLPAELQQQLAIDELMAALVNASHGQRLHSLRRWLVEVNVEGFCRSVDLDAELPTTSDKRRLQRQFKKEVGLTRKKVQRLWRVKRAMACLNSSDNLALADIAIDCGFYDQAHMNREFNELVGLSPLAYVSRW